tara:strand:- start:1706 stop:3142 length:1437 start_codon:yes stop_codon:yes gene_type:complete
MENYKLLTIDGIHTGLKNRSFSAKELAQEALRIAQEENDKYGIFLHFSPEQAIATAENIDRELADGKPLKKLAGVPIAIKDVILTEGIKTTCASRLLENYVAPYDATAVTRIKEAGGVIIGKTNCDEFAMGSSNENSAFYPVKNPMALDRVPGGSSGGSAAAVAGGFTPISLGSDTGGSIRQPASFCGVVGVLPTYGRVSRYGLTAFASSLDHIGPFSRTVKDSATLLEVIAGRDEKDSTSAAFPVEDYGSSLGSSLETLKIGVPKEYFGAGLDSEIGERIQNGLDVLKKLGCKISDISLPNTEYAIASYYLICTAEASANLARYDGVRYTTRSEDVTSLDEMYRKTRGEGFGPEVKRRIILGTYVLSAGYYDAHYLKAQKVRTLIATDFAKAFDQVDAIVTPVSPFPAFKLDEKTADPLEMYLSDIYTITASLAGIAGISVPCGETSEKLPVGMQILTNHFQEAKMLRIADAFEKAR